MKSPSQVGRMAGAKLVMSAHRTGCICIQASMISGSQTKTPARMRCCITSPLHQPEIKPTRARQQTKPQPVFPLPGWGFSFAQLRTSARSASASYSSAKRIIIARVSISFIMHDRMRISAARSRQCLPSFTLVGGMTSSRGRGAAPNQQAGQGPPAGRCGGTLEDPPSRHCIQMYTAAAMGQN